MTNSLQDDVVSKPFRIPELMPKIEELSARYNTICAPRSEPVTAPSTLAPVLESIN